MDVMTSPRIALAQRWWRVQAQVCAAAGAFPEEVRTELGERSPTAGRPAALCLDCSSACTGTRELPLSYQLTRLKADEIYTAFSQRPCEPDKHQEVQDNADTPGPRSALLCCSGNANVKRNGGVLGIDYGVACSSDAIYFLYPLPYSAHRIQTLLCLGQSFLLSHPPL
ncbi:hypothetical protein CB1_000353021 [Camelus ferus]|nr:hypothetical protein CB1_000353021 [Camelus ferus]